MLKHIVASVIAAVPLVLFNTPIAAQASYPSQPIKLVVAYPAGGGTDTTARLLAERLGRLLPQPIVIDNKSGAAGTIGATVVAKAPPDGYTLLFASAPELSVANIGMKNMAYDSVRDFRPITMVGKVRYVLVANTDLPVNNVAELVKFAIANPGNVNFGSFGNFTSNHLVGEMLGARAGIKIQHVPYRGSAPLLVDLMGGRVQISFDSMPNVMPLIKDGKIKPLAIATQERSPLLPDVPTMAESGIPDFVASTWFGLLAPAATPDSLVEQLRKTVTQVLQDEDARKAFQARYIEPEASTPQEFASFIASERAKWQKLADQIGLQPQ
jgi:tripartite-type tricarboxylate transporter receptor subunit TctC